MPMTFKKPSSPKPTEAELAILNALWKLGPSTVRVVHEELNQTAEQESGYTTTLKMLQIMTEKGLVKRDESQRSHIYEPLFTEQQVQRQLVGRLLDRAFGGSAKKLVMQALSGKK